MEESLYAFVREAWKIMEGGTPFIHGWHIEAIAEHLEACRRREIKNLLINVPPRSSKSSLISVAFPAWLWIHSPHEKFMYASYASSLATEHSLKCRRLIESSWYQERWGSVYHIVSDRNTMKVFENDKGGYRMCTSVGGSSTGSGGSFLVADDPNNAKDGESQTKRLSTNAWWSQVWSTRLNDPKNDVRILVQQRIHQDEVSGFIMANDDDKDWIKVIIPNEFEESRRCITIPLKKKKIKIIFEDDTVKLYDLDELVDVEEGNKKIASHLRVGDTCVFP
jgi:hypothetical protein